MAGTAATVSLYDARPFFDKALQHGLIHGIIDAQKLESIRTEAPKGMVQIARYFGSEFLRPELEIARQRMVNLVSLYLEVSCGGDLQRAAESLREHSFLSRSKGGSDMLKALIAMPQNSHFGMNERRGFSDAHIPMLAKWSMRSVTDYQAELAVRGQVEQVIDVAVWLAEKLGLDEDTLEEAGKDAEAVIRTALLVLATGQRHMPDWPAFEAMVLKLRKAKKPLVIELPEDLPDEWAAVVEKVRVSLVADLPKISDPAQAPRQLFDHTPAFMGRYFWLEDALAEVDHHDRMASDVWNKLTGGNTDDGSLLTLLLCVAAGLTPKTLLTEKSAIALLRKIHKTGFKPKDARQYLIDHAPHQYHDGYLQLWTSFVEEAEGLLLSDAVHAQKDALALMRRECYVK